MIGLFHAERTVVASTIGHESEQPCPMLQTHLKIRLTKILERQLQ
jgi:hypothetical protein